MSANFVHILLLICLAYVTEVSSKEPQAMQIFTAGDPDLYRWFHMIVSVKIASPDEADMKLRSESCNSQKSEHNQSMCEAYHLAMNTSNCPVFLLKAECAAVYMYSIRSFCSIYNSDIRNKTWEPYKVLTSLIHSALRKLSAYRPLPRSTILYRGLKKVFTIDAKGRFYFPQFVSSSLNKSVANWYGNKTRVLYVEVPKIAANLEGLTEIREEEVLLSPFEAFEVINKTGNAFYLRSSDAQDFIVGSSAKSWPCLQGAFVFVLVCMGKYFLVSLD